MSNSSTAEMLLEVDSGDGWLAREHNLVVWIPTPVDTDVAFRCIEPLLKTGDFTAAVAKIRRWPEPSVSFALVSLTKPTRVLVHGFDVLRHESKVELSPTPLTGPAKATLHQLPDASMMLQADGGEASSGRLVEGVIRAGSWRIHLSDPPGKGGNTRWVLDGSFGRLSLDADMTIGRSVDEQPSEHGLQLRDPWVSREHAVLLTGLRYPRIVDSGSKNGTWAGSTASTLNPVHGEVPYPLSDGDTVVVGSSRLTVRRIG